VGYQVVEVSDGSVPVVLPVPDMNGSAGQSPSPLAPSSPMGYSVVVVENDRAPRRGVASRGTRNSAARVARRHNPVLIWGCVGAAGCCVLGFTLYLAVMRAADEAPAQGPLPALFAQRTPRQVNIPEVALVKVPQEAAVEKPAAAPKNNAKPVAVAKPGAALPALPAERVEQPEKVVPPANAVVLPELPACDKDGCKVDGPADVRPDRETFGTTVAFARNAMEASRLAGEQRKLTFVLHVSGNFEEARFT